MSLIDSLRAASEQLEILRQRMDAAALSADKQADAEARLARMEAQLARAMQMAQLAAQAPSPDRHPVGEAPGPLGTFNAQAILGPDGGRLVDVDGRPIVNATLLGAPPGAGVLLDGLGRPVSGGSGSWRGGRPAGGRGSRESGAGGGGGFEGIDIDASDFTLESVGPDGGAQIGFDRDALREARRRRREAYMQLSSGGDFSRSKSQGEQEIVDELKTVNHNLGKLASSMSADNSLALRQAGLG